MPPINEKSDSSFDASVTYNLSILREATMNYSHNIDDLAYPTLPATIINIPKQIKISKKQKNLKSSKESSLQEIDRPFIQSHDALMRQPTLMEMKTGEDDEVLPALPAPIIGLNNLENFQSTNFSSGEELFDESFNQSHNFHSASDLLLSPIQKENSSRIEDIPAYDCMIKESTNIDMQNMEPIDADKEFLTVSMLPLNSDKEFKNNKVKY